MNAGGHRYPNFCPYEGREIGLHAEWLFSFSVNFAAFFFEGVGHFFHAFIQRLFFFQTFLCGVVAHVLRDFH